MDVRLMAGVAGELANVNVAALCRERGISRKTFYKWRARYLAEGLDGLEERSRRPRRSPGRLSPVTEDAIVWWRKHLADQGLDAGAATICWHLAQAAAGRPPSEATIWRVLVRRGFVVPQPHKRPRRSWTRFEAGAPNECWQIDATSWALASGQRVEIVNIVDDCSRLLVASVAMATVTSEGAWAVLAEAGQRLGLPARCLSDNGLAFSGRLRGYEVVFERRLRAAGVAPRTARPHHPQTCGKVERFQQTLKRWLGRRARTLHTLAELQAALDDFAAYYNWSRPHRALGRRTPAARWGASAVAGPAPEPLPAPARRIRVVVDAKGTVSAAPFRIGLGSRYAGRTADIAYDATHATVYVDGRLVRHLALTGTGGYQPTGIGRGGKGVPKRRGA